MPTKSAGGSRSGLGGPPIGAIGGISSVVIVSGTPFEKISSLTAMPSQGVTLDAANGTITCQVGGLYLLLLSGSFESTVNSVDIIGSIYVNGVASVPVEIGFQRDVSNSASIGSVAGFGTVTLSQGDVVDVRFDSTTSTTLDFSNFGLIVASKSAVIAPVFLHNVSPDLQGLGPGYIHLNQVEYDALRPQLTTDTTFYVSPTGSDVTGDGLIGNPFQTIQHTLDYISTLDTASYNVTVDLYAATGSGTVTYTEEIIITDLTGSGELILLGSVTSRDNAIIKPSDTSGLRTIDLSLVAATTVTLKDFKIDLATTTTANWQYGIFNEGVNKFITDGLWINGGISTGTGDRAYQLKRCAVDIKGVDNDPKFSGDIGYAFIFSLTCSANQIGPLAFDTDLLISVNKFALIQLLAVANFGNANYSTVAIPGQKYDVDGNSALQLVGKVLPGNTAGTTTNGGVAY